MINQKQLRYFITLAEQLHYGKAAESCFITQPSLSRQIVALEEEVGCQLFVRHSRAVNLTAAGRVFLIQARSIVAAIDNAVILARAVDQGEEGILHIAFSSYFTSEILPSVIRQFSKQFPAVELLMDELSPVKLNEAVLNGETDLAFVLKTPETKELGYFRLQEEPLCAVLPVNHPLATHPKLALSDLAQESFIISPKEATSALFSIIEAWCKRHGFEPKIRIKTHMQHSIINFVAENLGVAIVPVSMRSARTQSVVYRDIADAPHFEVGIIWKKSNDNPCLLSFLAMIKSD